MLQGLKPGPDRCWTSMNVSRRVPVLQYPLQYFDIAGRLSHMIEFDGPFYRVSEPGFASMSDAVRDMIATGEIDSACGVLPADDEEQTAD